MFVCERIYSVVSWKICMCSTRIYIFHEKFWGVLDASSICWIFSQNVWPISFPPNDSAARVGKRAQHLNYWIFGKNDLPGKKNRYLAKSPRLLLLGFVFFIPFVLFFTGVRAVFSLFFKFEQFFFWNIKSTKICTGRVVWSKIRLEEHTPSVTARGYGLARRENFWKILLPLDCWKMP